MYITYRYYLTLNRTIILYTFIKIHFKHRKGNPFWVYWIYLYFFSHIDLYLFFYGINSKGQETPFKFTSHS